MSKTLIVRIKEKGSKGRGCFEYKNEISLDNFQQLALLLSDLEKWGTNIEKAFREFQKQKEEDRYPF